MRSAIDHRSPVAYFIHRAPVPPGSILDFRFWIVDLMRIDNPKKLRQAIRFRFFY